MANILVVDDEPRIVGFLRRSLSNHGFEVDGSLTGADALIRLRTKSYDLLLLDLMMPEIDGVQVLRAVGDMEHQPQVIIVSARSDVSAKVASLEDVIRSKVAAGRPKDDAQVILLRQTLAVKQKLEE